MATAREKLLQALSSILSLPKDQTMENNLKKLLNTYRVQIKPNENFPKDQIARDVLLANIMEKWTLGIVSEQDIASLITPFRMQLKQSIELKDSRPLVNNFLDQGKGAKDGGKARKGITETVSQQENAYFKGKNKGLEQTPPKSTPVAGGPAPKNSGRGQCPKCRSIGLVLARSYGGEDYHSCIYCGYQSHLSKVDPKLDLPLAAHLLGGAFVNPEFDGDE